MGKYYDSLGPGPGAAETPMPSQHEMVDKPKSPATQGVRTTESGKPVEAPKK